MKESTKRYKNSTLKCGTTGLQAFEANAHVTGGTKVFDLTGRLKDGPMVGQCPKSAVMCPNECGAEGLTLDTVAAHTANRCPNRLLPCGNGCVEAGELKQLEAWRLEHHMETECPLRMMTCMWHESHLVTAEELKAHEKSCPSRDVSCPMLCGAKLKIPGVEEHLALECPLNFQQCTLGCGLKLPVFAMEEHVSLNGQCPEREMFCPLGCSMFPFKLKVHAVDFHVRYECPKRLDTDTPAVCPHCHIRVDQAEYGAHLEKCLMLSNTTGRKGLGIFR